MRGPRDNDDQDRARSADTAAGKETKKSTKSKQMKDSRHHGRSGDRSKIGESIRLAIDTVLNSLPWP